MTSMHCTVLYCSNCDHMSRCLQASSVTRSACTCSQLTAHSSWLVAGGSELDLEDQSWCRYWEVANNHRGWWPGSKLCLRYNTSDQLQGHTIESMMSLDYKNSCLSFSDPKHSIWKRRCVIKWSELVKCDVLVRNPSLKCCSKSYICNTCHKSHS